MDEDFSREELRGDAEQFGELLDNGEISYREAEDLDNLIEYFIEEGQLNRALKAAEFGLEWHPFSAAILQRKAYIFHITGRTLEGLELLDRAELFEPNDADLYALKGEMLAHLERFEESVYSFEEALKYTDDRSEIYISLAFTYQSWGKPSKAIRYLSMILENEVENEQLLFEIAYCFDLMDEPLAAIEFFSQFTDQHPYSHAAWLNLGNWYQQVSNFEKAIWAYDFAIAITPHLGSAYMQKGLCLFELEQYEEAIESFNQTLELDGPDGLVYCNIANCYEELDEVKKARGFYKMAIKNDATLSDAWFGLGMTYKTEENYTQAIHYIQRAMRIDPEEMDYLVELGEIYLIQEDYEKAEQTFSKICRAEPWIPEAWLDWALCQFENGRAEIAVKTLEDGLDLFPEDHRFMYRLASYGFVLGWSVRAFEYLNSALTINWGDHHLLFIHAPFLKESESVAETIDLYRDSN